jgi:hypothetical protein
MKKTSQEGKLMDDLTFGFVEENHNLKIGGQYHFVLQGASTILKEKVLNEPLKFTLEVTHKDGATVDQWMTMAPKMK